MSDRPTIAITSGEPAGIGPDLCVMAAQQAWQAPLVAIADPALLRQRAGQLGLPLELEPYGPAQPPRPSVPGVLRVEPAATLAAPAAEGRIQVSDDGVDWRPVGRLAGGSAVRAAGVAA